MLGSAADAEDVLQETWLRWVDVAVTVIVVSLGHPVPDRLGRRLELCGRLFRRPAGPHPGSTICRRKSGGYGGRDIGTCELLPGHRPKRSGVHKTGATSTC
jgi:hypothetical protein